MGKLQNLRQITERKEVMSNKYEYVQQKEKLFMNRIFEFQEKMVTRDWLDKFPWNTIQMHYCLLFDIITPDNYKNIINQYFDNLNKLCCDHNITQSIEKMTQIIRILTDGIMEWDCNQAILAANHGIENFALDEIIYYFEQQVYKFKEPFDSFYGYPHE